MRLDFNQRGSWRNGPEFSERDQQQVKEGAAWLADLCDAKLRIVGDNGEVVAYRDAAGNGWRESKTRGQALVPSPGGRRV